MRWTPGGVSSDIEDRRGSSGGGFGFGRGPTIGCGGAIVLLVLSLLTGKNFFALFDGSGGGGAVQQQQRAPGEQTPPANQSPAEAKEVQFVSFVLDDLQKTWAQTLDQKGVRYQKTTLVLFRDATDTGCGYGQAASGPFYCPNDGKVYIDLGFYDELQQRFGASGDFAQAYVLAHEVGHHIQNLIGISDKVHNAEQNDPSRANEYSVRLELQADCFAGIWGHSTEQRNILESGDVDEGLAAAAAVGDDRIQRMSGRAVNPEKWTHGSSEQRAQWFRRGFESGKISDCDTFGR
ncbi:MAG: neutral zinc metallopeptidase [Acidobacteria bacterium]|nr:neutral zinc metallopeptidase [Acidobacteriota bacterium]MBV9474866.1 neutral zinc metallopeptidase [Acidobacteriota bacterium]